MLRWQDLRPATHMLMAAFKQTINKSWGNKRAFTLTEVLIALGIIAVIAVLILPVTEQVICSVIFYTGKTDVKFVGRLADQ